ncbi:MAG TPA: DUF1858 domain-containing protein [Vicinamibacterales bacterium]|nr:DUF1858 domain-containing protein [Vicinamibacterales bacterium]
MELLTPFTTIAAVLARWPQAAAVFVGRRMACVGCEMNGFETIRDAAAIYGVPEDDLLRDLRRAIRDGSHPAGELTDSPGTHEAGAGRFAG